MMRRNNEGSKREMDWLEGSEDQAGCIDFSEFKEGDIGPVNTTDPPPVEDPPDNNGGGSFSGTFPAVKLRNRS